MTSLRSLAPRRRGFSLIEMCLVITVLAIVGALAVPAAARTMARQRVTAAAQHLAADVAQARQEANQQGLPVHLETQTGANWCWAVTRHAGCGCGEPSPCRLKVTRAADHPGVTLAAARSLQLSPDGSANHSVAASLQAGSETVQVDVGPLGRARWCDPQGHIAGMKKC